MRAVIAAVGVAIVVAAGLLHGASTDPHGKLAWDCVSCHTTESWHRLAEDMKFSHAETGFRLLGAHKKVACRSCHKDLRFSNIGTACADCHVDHHMGQLGTDCQSCHIVRDWGPQTNLLSQHAERGFPLTGVHAIADCDACHRNEDRQEFTDTPTECISCHRNDLEAAVSPDHNALAFNTDCQRCHSAAFGSWTVTTYAHPAVFPLTGAHANLECTACHQQTFVGTPTDCIGCHDADFRATADPDHEAAGFSTDCVLCHTTTAWTPASFDHAKTAFPLDGQHAVVDCVACHQTGYAGTPTDCYACHQNDYEATSDPSHIAAHFPTNCESCHSASGWTPADWDHDAQYFPIYSGTHREKWQDCSECHTIPTDFSSFDCTNCHEHNQTDMDAKHTEVTNYQYLSSACYSCHPTGSSDD
ncbi:MAG: hypothetical protein AB1483_00515 [Candidatus Zixiibacteriota bacterium]